MAFNPEPNKQAVEVLFSQKTNSPNHPPLFFNVSTVSKVNVHKDLGLNLDPKLSFVSHINKKINKAKKIIGILKLQVSFSIHRVGKGRCEITTLNSDLT